MERLTQRENDKLIMVKQDNGEYIPAYRDEDNFKAIKKLADYEDLEEQGLLVRLPCKEAYSRSGDFVYLIYDYEIIECVHCGLGIDPTYCDNPSKRCFIVNSHEHLFKLCP